MPQLSLNLEEGTRPGIRRIFCPPLLSPQPQPCHPLLALWVWQMEKQRGLFCAAPPSSPGALTLQYWDEARVKT